MSLRVHLVDIVDHNTSDRELQQRMIELENLTNTYGGLVIIKTIQKKDKPNYTTFIGSGKLDEIIQDMVASKSDLLIIGNLLKPAQIYNISERMRLHPLVQESDIKLQVRDKVDLILKIFAKHAKSTEAKLQIELAAIKHMWPRIYGMGLEMSKQGGSAGWAGWAMRWLGETNTERMRRELKDKSTAIEKRLKKYEKMRTLQRTRRRRLQFTSFWIVWYTNAWKSSLLNALSKKDPYIANELFATLGTEVGKVYLMNPHDNSSAWKEVLMIDTIGFIRDLPPQLIKAFASTLEDSIQSDILLHVIDASDPDIITKAIVVENILETIGANQEVIYIFNKIDKIDETRQQNIANQWYWKNIVFVSTLTGEWLDELKALMRKLW